MSQVPAQGRSEKRNPGVLPGPSQNPEHCSHQGEYPEHEIIKLCLFLDAYMVIFRLYVRLIEPLGQINEPDLHRGIFLLHVGRVVSECEGVKMSQAD